MAGHSHWAGIKHKKALVDAKRGKVWSKLAKAIIVAAQMGGGDPDTNLRLRYAIDDAKSVSMPKDNIQRAIKRGTGELGGGKIEEVVYEGYAAGGVAVMCEVLTDNRNRTAPEVRKLFERGGGKMGATGCVGWKFDRRGLFTIKADATDEDTLMDIALEAGAEDVKNEDDLFEVITPVEAFQAVKTALAEAEIPTEMAEVTQIPQSTVDVEEPKVAAKVLKMIEALDDHDDIQTVSSDFNVSEEVMAEVEKLA